MLQRICQLLVGLVAAATVAGCLVSQTSLVEAMPAADIVEPGTYLQFNFNPNEEPCPSGAEHASILLGAGREYCFESTIEVAGSGGSYDFEIVGPTEGGAPRSFPVRIGTPRGAKSWHLAEIKMGDEGEDVFSLGLVATPPEDDRLLEFQMVL